MRKILFSLFICMFLICSYGQVFNSAGTMSKGSCSVGIEPVLYLNGSSESFLLFLHGGYGITSGIDFAMKLGVGNTNYYGGDLEWAIKKNLSLTTGAHHYNDFGLDASLNFNIPVNKDARIYSGLDLDIIFADEIEIPLWIPVGVEINIKNKTSFIFEAEISLINQFHHILGGGIVLFF